MMTTATLALLLLLQSPTAQATGSIGGRVVRSGTNDPIAGAEVELNRVADWDNTAATATTGRDGRFRMEDVEPGIYVLKVEREGYAAQFYGARQPGFVPMVESLRGILATEHEARSIVTVVKLEPGGSIRDIVIPLSRNGVVSGRILDRERRPMVDVRVKLIPDVYNAGGVRLVLPLDETVRTDDRGQFRLPDAPAGRYYIVVGPIDREGRYGGNTFYPGVRDFSRAVSVDVSAGRETRLSDFSLQLAPETFKVTGRVIDRRTDREDSIDLDLVSRNPGGMVDIPDLVHVSLDDDGSFEAEDVPPGSYWIAAHNSSFDTIKVFALTEIEVTRSDVGGVVVQVQDPFSISGRVTIDGAPPEESRSTKEIRVGVELPIIPFAFLLLGSSHSALLGSGGTFTVEGVFSSPFRVFATDLPPDVYVKRMRFGGADLVNGRIALTGPSTDTLDIDLSTRGGRIQGTLVDNKRKPVGGVQVVLIPKGVDSHPDLFKTAYSDASGRYELRGIAPGEYTLLAWEKPEASYFDADYVRRYMALGKSVRIAEGSSETVEIKIIER